MKQQKCNVNTLYKVKENLTFKLAVFFIHVLQSYLVVEPGLELVFLTSSFVL